MNIFTQHVTIMFGQNMCNNFNVAPIVLWRTQPASSLRSIIGVPYQWPNHINHIGCSNSNAKVRSLQRSFLSERVIPYWNKLSSEVKSAESVLSFKVKLESFKKSVTSQAINYVRSDCYFWEVSHEVLSRIEGINYLENKLKHNEYLWFNPHVAKKRFVNLYSTGRYQ